MAGSEAKPKAGFGVNQEYVQPIDFINDARNEAFEKDIDVCICGGI